MRAYQLGHNGPWVDLDHVLEIYPVDPSPDLHCFILRYRLAFTNHNCETWVNLKSWYSMEPHWTPEERAAKLQERSTACKAEALKIWQDFFDAWKGPAKPEKAPITLEQLQALPELDGWWLSGGFVEAIRAVERFHGIS